MTNCGDDVTHLWFFGFLLSLVVALVPFVLALRKGNGALGCGSSLALGLLAPLVAGLEPSYIGIVRPLLDCGSITRVPVIIGAAPLLVLVGAILLVLLTIRD